MLPAIAIVILTVVTSHSTTAQDCTKPRFDSETYSGHVVISPEGIPSLLGDNSLGGIAFLSGCTDAGMPDVTVQKEFATQFSVQDSLRAVGKKELILAEGYNLVTNKDIIFTMQACDTATPPVCDTATVTVTYPYNAQDPSFNRAFGQGQIADAEACADGCQVLFKPPFSCSDADGDALEYSINPFTTHSNLFEISDPKTLAISYKGRVVSQSLNVTLLVKAKENRKLDARSVVAVVNIELLTTATITTKSPAEPTNPTETPTAPECDDKKEKLYFIIMLALASVLGAVLLLLILIPLCIKCCRSTSLGISSSRKTTVKKSAVYTAGASYKSFSEMNYVTLQDMPPSYNSTPEFGVKAEKHSSGRVRSRQKSSKRDLPSAGSFSSDSTASVQDRRRGDTHA